MTVKVKILRISEGREHPAEIRGDVLHNEGKRHILSVSRRLKDKKAKRQKGQERHIVRYQHRSDEGYADERDNRHAKISCTDDYLPRDEGKETYVPQSADDGERAEKAGQRPQIEIPEIILIGWHYEGGHHRRDDRNTENGILLYKL